MPFPQHLITQRLRFTIGQARHTIEFGRVLRDQSTLDEQVCIVLQAVGFGELGDLTGEQVTGDAGKWVFDSVSGSVRRCSKLCDCLGY